MKIEIISNRSGIFGGLRRLYCLAQYFIEAGHTAVVNIADGTTNRWFEHNVPENQPIIPDIRIVPEVLQERHPTAKNILFYQANWDPPDGLYDAVVTTSTYLQDSLLKEGCKSQIINYGLDAENFKPDSSKRSKKPIISYMPRKNKSEAILVKQLTENIDFLEIDGVSEAEVIPLLQSSNIFLAISRLEGFGIPPAEAALCGCTVIGYHGFGGKDWMTPQTYLPASDPQEISTLIKEVLNNESSYEDIRQRARKVLIENYSIKTEKEQWLSLLDRVIHDDFDWKHHTLLED